MQDLYVLAGTGTANQAALWAGASSLNGNTGLTYDPTNEFLTILGDVGKQLHLKYDASNHAAFEVGSAGAMTITLTGTSPSATITGAYASEFGLTFTNTSANAAAAAVCILGTPTTGGDVYFSLRVTGGGSRWAVGVDNSDGDSLKFVPGTTPSDTAAIKIDTSRNIFFPDFTAGSIPFFAANGEIVEDNAGLSFDDSTDDLSLNGDYFWYSGTSFSGQLAHNNSADRVYTFPDATGTVMTTATASGLFTSGSVAFADSAGQLTQNNTAFFWDNTNINLNLTRSTATTTPTLDIIQSSTGDAAIRLAIGTTTSWALGPDNSATGDPFKIAYAASGTAALGTNDRFTIESDGEVTVAQWFQVGTATDSATQGDLVAGLTGAARMFYDQSVTSLTLYDASGNADVVLHANGTSYFNAGSLGIGTTGPDRPLDVLSTAGPQARFTYTDGSVYAEFEANSSGNLAVASTGPGLIYSGTGNPVYLQVTNTGAGGQAAIYLQGGSGGLGQFINYAGDFYLSNEDSSGAIILRTGVSVEKMRITSGGSVTHTATSGGTEFAVNETQADCDFRVEGDSISHMIFTDATATTENIALLAAAAPGWNAMDRGIFIGDTSSAPTGNPTGGGYLYVESGALKYRGSGGTITTVGPA
jgi:hypothetical protein